MSDHDIETAHEIDDNDQQLTTKRVHVDGDVHEFEGEPGGEFEYAGDGTAPEVARAALAAHLGDDEEIGVDDDHPSA